MGVMEAENAAMYHVKKMPNNDIKMKVGIVSSTVIESTPVCIFIVDSILLRIELFRKAPSPTPGPAPETSTAPAPDASSPTTDAGSPTPMMSPLAPPTSSMAGDPEDDPEQYNGNKANVVNKIPHVPSHHPITRKLATQIANRPQKPPVEYTETMMEQINRMDEKIEMKNVEDWSVVNIDSSDEKNELTVVEYIDDIYA
ncbi:hypothetical protein BC332_27834 [Capsicum chinense]|nr:hypothetical protein BC332_27834 [Capsicum chinense]